MGLLKNGRSDIHTSGTSAPVMAWFPIAVAVILGAILLGEIAMVPILVNVDGHSGAGHNSSVIKLSSFSEVVQTTAPPPTTSAPTPAPPSPAS